MTKHHESKQTAHTSLPAWAKLNYYGAMIRDATVGPRRELTLRIELWPEGQTFFGGGDVVSLRFGAIANYEEIQRFFAKTPTDGLHCLRYLSESRPQREIIEIEFDGRGDRVRIVAASVSFGGKRVVEW